ncbi:MAG: korA2 [Ignavibacteria bacterium]|nr:MAG: korA2 [Ignavibacteria bacterium]KAF0161769.1 MAG: korA2 [Ignavibacteria bacterium]
MTANYTLIDGSKLIVESLVQSGVESFVSYPITPANWINQYASQRFPTMAFAPDEITVAQWIAGLSSAGKLSATATSFPGLALMVESLNMSFMMELPMIIVVVQRLGPSTGSATVGAQGDLLLLNSLISGGYNIPVFSISNITDCWKVTEKAVHAAVELRTPVVLLTSKEMVMTSRSIDLALLPELKKAQYDYYKDSKPYVPYAANDKLVPPFLPLTSNEHQVRINSSTHDDSGTIKKATKAALGNTIRLHNKIQRRMNEFLIYEHDEDKDKNILIVSYDITGESTREAVKQLRNSGLNVSALYLKTIIPFPKELMTIINAYENVIYAEENLTGLLVKMIYGNNPPNNVSKVNRIGAMISPLEIIKETERCLQAC